MHFARIINSVLAILLLSQSVHAQLQLISPNQPAVSTTTPTESNNTEELVIKRKQIGDQLRVAQRTLDAAKQAAKEDAPPPAKLQREVDLLKQLDAVLAQLKTAKDQEKDLQDELIETKGQLEAVRMGGPTEDKPYSFLLLDQLRDDQSSRSTRNELRKAGLADTEQALQRVQENLDEKQKAVRLLKSELQSTQEDTAKSEKTTALKIAEAEEKVAAEMAALKKQELTNEKLAIDVQATELELLSERINWISKDVVFSAKDRQDQLAKIDKREADIKAAIRTAESNLALAEQELAHDKRELDSAVSPSASLIEQVEARQLIRQKLLRSQTILNARLQRVGKARELWDRRYQVITTKATPEELITWVSEAKSYLSQLEREVRNEQSQIDGFRGELTPRENELQTSAENLGDSKRWIERQRDELAKTIRIYDESINSINTTIRLSKKLIDEIEGDDWTIADWMSGTWYYITKIWNTELYNAEDNPLTVGKIINGVLLVLAGFFIASKLSRLLGRRLPHTIGINENGAAAIQSLSFYAMVVLFTLMALRVVNVPLTLFTFLGGAIAIGVGFGSQNIVNNFISGLILLAERPIRVGDLIQLDTLHGTVEHVGTRSTRIRTGNNMEIIVPNSSFLESNVLNYTLGDNMVRTSVAVGLAYGSPTRDAAKLLKRAAQEHGLVMQNPEPFVWFVDFGDNSLNFELHFWVEVRNLTERKRVESDMRFKIDHLFREAGIVIAYPQRDVHIDVQRPLDIRLLGDSPAQTMADGSLSAA